MLRRVGASVLSRRPLLEGSSLFSFPATGGLSCLVELLQLMMMIKNGGIKSDMDVDIQDLRACSSLTC